MSQGIPQKLCTFSLVLLLLSACGASPTTNSNPSAPKEDAPAAKEQEDVFPSEPESTYLLSKISYYDDNLIFLYADSYTYDDLGNVLTYTYNRYYTESYEYDEQGRLATTTYYAGDEIDSRSEYEYNELGLVTKCSTYYKQVNDFVTIEYDYDQFNNKISETYTKKSPKVWGTFYDCTFEYDGNQLISSTMTLDGQIRQYTEYDYGKNQENITDYRSDGTVEHYTECYIVQPWDICLYQKAYAPDGNTQSARTSELQYDSQGKLLEAIVYDDGELVGSIELEYDDNENIVRQTHYDEMGFVTREMRYEYVTLSAS